MNHSNKQKTITEVNTDMKKETAKKYWFPFWLTENKERCWSTKNKKVKAGGGSSTLPAVTAEKWKTTISLTKFGIEHWGVIYLSKLGKIPPVQRLSQIQK